MSNLFQWLASESLSAMIFIIAISLALVLIAMMYATAFRQGREVSFWPPKIGERPPTIGSASKLGNVVSISKGQKTPRVSLMCSTTYEIEKSSEKQSALRVFFQSFIAEIERTPICINTGGSEPLRSVILENYANKLKTLSKTQLESSNSKVRWYWYLGDISGYGFEPPVYESRQTSNAAERPIKEVLDSDAIVAFTGKTGTHEQLERLLRYHNQKQYGIDFNRRPLILLCWFGGSVRDFVNEDLSELDWLLGKYPELEPTIELEDWYVGDNPRELAHKLGSTLQKLLVQNK